MEYEAKANELAEKFSNDESVFACAKEIAAFGRECAADAYVDASRNSGASITTGIWLQKKANALRSEKARG